MKTKLSLIIFIPLLLSMISCDIFYGEHISQEFEKEKLISIKQDYLDNMSLVDVLDCSIEMVNFEFGKEIKRDYAKIKYDNNKEFYSYDINYIQETEIYDNVRYLYLKDDFYYYVTNDRKEGSESKTFEKYLKYTVPSYDSFMSTKEMINIETIRQIITMDAYLNYAINASIAETTMSNQDNSSIKVDVYKKDGNGNYFIKEVVETKEILFEGHTITTKEIYETTITKSLISHMNLSEEKTEILNGTVVNNTKTQATYNLKTSFNISYPDLTDYQDLNDVVE